MSDKCVWCGRPKMTREIYVGSAAIVPRAYCYAEFERNLCALHDADAQRQLRDEARAETATVRAEAERQRDRANKLEREIRRAREAIDDLIKCLWIIGKLGVAINGIQTARKSLRDIEDADAAAPQPKGTA